MKREIEDLAAQLASGEIDKPAFDKGVEALIEDSAQPPAEPAPEATEEGEQSAVRSYEIKKAANRARLL